MTMKQMLLFMYKTASKRKLHLSWEEIDFMNLYLDVRLARITKKKLFFCRLLYSTTQTHDKCLRFGEIESKAVFAA